MFRDQEMLRSLFHRLARCSGCRIIVICPQTASGDPMRLGIDFGTTNSSISHYDGDKLHRVVLDPQSDNPHVLPSLIYINRAQHAAVGTAAAAEYLSHETGRLAHWERRRIGEIDVVAADMSFVRTVHAMVDTAAQGRLLQYIKTALRDPTYEGTQVFGRFYTADELIAVLLSALKERAQQAFGADSDAVVIGRPVRFSDSPAITARAEEILYKAARWAGFREIGFELEPVGAAYHYHRTAPERQTAFIFDFGGGTLDFTVAQVGGGASPQILGTHGVLVGGDDLDRRIMQSLHSHFGADARLDGKPVLPPYLFDWLDNWQSMPILSRPDYVRLMDEGMRASTDRKAIAALRALVTRNLGFKLFREIEHAKKSLSEKWVTPLRMNEEAIELEVTLTRRDFERLISRQVKKVEEGVSTALELANLRPAQVDVVLRTGGTSAVPVFRGLLERIFGEQKIADIDLLTSVVGGLAVVAHEGGGSKPHYVERYNSIETPAPGSIRVKATRPGERYEFRIGAKCYTDHDYTLLRIPVELSGLPAIRTAQEDKASTSKFFCQFILAHPTRVYVAFDSAVQVLPEWLRAFAPQEMQVVVDQFGTERLLKVFASEFPPGNVQLGGSRAKGVQGDVFMNYLVILSLQSD